MDGIDCDCENDNDKEMNEDVKNNESYLPTFIIISHKKFI